MGTFGTITRQGINLGGCINFTDALIKRVTQIDIPLGISRNAPGIYLKAGGAATAEMHA